ncbi:MAG: hypothetical protein GX339_06290 [Tissierellia bacterium]|nr:hypothetical protein [Tissierellia bacterium]
MMYEEIVVIGTGQGRLMMFILELSEEDYICKKALNIGDKNSYAIHSIFNYEKAIYMADSFNNKIYKYDMISNEVNETNVGRDPRHMCVDKENMYVANFESDNISIIDLKNFLLLGSIPAGIKAHDVIYSEKNNCLYTTCYEENQVLEYGLTTGKSRIFKTEGKPMHLVIYKDTIIVMTYFVNGSIHTKINFINLYDGKIEKIIIIEGLATDFQYDYINDMLYIINIVDKNLYLLDPLARKVINEIYLGGYPEAVTFDKNNIYVTNSKKQEITIIEKNGPIKNSIHLQFVPDLIKAIY